MRTQECLEASAQRATSAVYVRAREFGSRLVSFADPPSHLPSNGRSCYKAAKTCTDMDIALWSVRRDGGRAVPQAVKNAEMKLMRTRARESGDVMVPIICNLFGPRGTTPDAPRWR